MSSALDMEVQRWSRSLRGAPAFGITTALVLLVSAALWLRGITYYPLPLEERVDHADYDVLSPTGSMGRMYGVVGLALILLNLGYLLRRRFPHWPIGRMRLWLDAHVITGLTSGLFVAFHTAFQLRSPVAMVTALTLAITIATGVVGRFFYAFVPRVEGELAQRISDLGALLPGLELRVREGLRKLPATESTASAGLWSVARTMPRWLDEASARRMFVMTTFEQFAERGVALECLHARPLAREVAKLAAREVLAVAGRELLRAWRPWHRLCAMTMALGVVLHVGVALFFGYAWDFGG